MTAQPTRNEGQTTAADCADLLQRIKPLAQEFEIVRQKQKNIDIGFNLFELISDHYYRETFHSDILHALLNPTGKHEGGGEYLDLFLKFIKSRGANVNLLDYSNARVEKEVGRIDILIKDEVSKKAIIIENKINDAGDMDVQLPRYLECVSARGYTCDAIIYLRLNGEADPDMKGWTSDQIEQVKNSKLKVIRAYDGTDDGSEKDLLKGWILKCKDAAKENSDAQHILRQYGKIIEKLGGNIMNKPIMKELYEILVKDENFKTALSFKKMLDELRVYGAERIVEKFESDYSPFQKPRRHGDGALFEHANCGEADLQMWIWVCPDYYSFWFFDRKDDRGSNGQAKAMLQKMGCLEDYVPEDGKFTRKFAFPSQEEDLIQHMTDFKKKLDKEIESVSRSIP